MYFDTHAEKRNAAAALKKAFRERPELQLEILSFEQRMRRLGKNLKTTPTTTIEDQTTPLRM